VQYDVEFHREHKYQGFKEWQEKENYENAEILFLFIFTIRGPNVGHIVIYCHIMLVILT